MRRSVIFANGEIGNLATVRGLLQPDDWIVAADGGTVHALACGCRPHLVIGDLDSLPPAQVRALRAAGVQIISHPADKDETDLELALLHVAAHRPATLTRVLVVGALGGRLDQMLANIQLLALPELVDLEVRIVDGVQVAQLIRGDATISHRDGRRVSLIPLGGDARGVTTSGLAWPLNGESLRFGQARGVSNILTGPTAHIQLAGGLLLCIQSPPESGT